MDTADQEWEEFERTLGGLKKATSLREQLNVISAQLNEIELDTKKIEEIKNQLVADQNADEVAMQGDVGMNLGAGIDPNMQQGEGVPVPPDAMPPGENINKAVGDAEMPTEPIADAVNMDTGDDKVIALFNQLIQALSESAHGALDSGDIGRLMALTNMQSNLANMMKDLGPLVASVPQNDMDGGVPLAKSEIAKGPWSQKKRPQIQTYSTEENPMGTNPKKTPPVYNAREKHELKSPGVDNIYPESDMVRMSVDKLLDKRKKIVPTPNTSYPDFVQGYIDRENANRGTPQDIMALLTYMWPQDASSIKEVINAHPEDPRWDVPHIITAATMTGKDYGELTPSDIRRVNKIQMRQVMQNLETAANKQWVTPDLTEIAALARGYNPKMLRRQDYKEEDKYRPRPKDLRAKDKRQDRKFEIIPSETIRSNEDAWPAAYRDMKKQLNFGSPTEQLRWLMDHPEVSNIAPNSFSGDPDSVVNALKGSFGDSALRAILSHISPNSNAAGYYDALFKNNAELQRLYELEERLRGEQDSLRDEYAQWQKDHATDETNEKYTNATELLDNYDTRRQAVMDSLPAGDPAARKKLVEEFERSAENAKRYLKSRLRDDTGFKNKLARLDERLKSVQAKRDDILARSSNEVNQRGPAGETTEFPAQDITNYLASHDFNFENPFSESTPASDELAGLIMNSMGGNYAPHVLAKQMMDHSDISKNREMYNDWYQDAIDHVTNMSTEGYNDDLIYKLLENEIKASRKRPEAFLEKLKDMRKQHINPLQFFDNANRPGDEDELGMGKAARAKLLRAINESGLDKSGFDNAYDTMGQWFKDDPVRISAMEKFRANGLSPVVFARALPHIDRMSRVVDANGRPMVTQSDAVNEFIRSIKYPNESAISFKYVPQVWASSPRDISDPDTLDAQKGRIGDAEDIARDNANKRLYRLSGRKFIGAYDHDNDDIPALVKVGNSWDLNKDLTRTNVEQINDFFREAYSHHTDPKLLINEEHPLAKDYKRYVDIMDSLPSSDPYVEYEYLSDFWDDMRDKYPMPSSRDHLAPSARALRVLQDKVKMGPNTAMDPSRVWTDTNAEPIFRDLSWKRADVDLDDDALKSSGYKVDDKWYNDDAVYHSMSEDADKFVVPHFHYYPIMDGKGQLVGYDVEPVNPSDEYYSEMTPERKRAMDRALEDRGEYISAVTDSPYRNKLARSYIARTLAGSMGFEDAESGIPGIKDSLYVRKPDNGAVSDRETQAGKLIASADTGEKKESDKEGDSPKSSGKTKTLVPKDKKKDESVPSSVDVSLAMDHGKSKKEVLREINKKPKKE